MCLYPKLIRNRRYLPNKKNGGVPPVCPDERLLYVTAACGKCFECMKQKGRAWQVRLSEEIRQDPKAIFLTDIHFPYQDNDALEMALESGQKWGANAIYLNGDTMDCYQISRFIKDRRMRDMSEELS